VDSFLTFINQQTWRLNEKRSLLAVSGGVDSVVLAHLFHKYGFEAGIAHCNFALRGEESELDEAFVRQMAADFGFEFHLERFDIKAYKEMESVSTQMAARDLRYAWFEKIREQNNFDWIVTAHHINDSLETVLLNLVRGTGLAGLTGISPQNKHLIRPLLHASRQEVLEYAYANGLQWREDKSNESDNYSRNLIRHKVIPIFKQLNPSLEQTFLVTSERITSADAVLTSFLEDWKKKHLRAANRQMRLAIHELLSTALPGHFLWSIIQDLGFKYPQIQQIINALNGIPGKTFHSNTHILLCDRDDIVITSIGYDRSEEIIIAEPEGTFPLEAGSLALSLQRKSAPLAQAFDQKNIACFNAEKIRLPLKLRKWQAGDKFAPFGMKGKFKKVSDLFTDLKLDRFEKQLVWLLENGNGDLLWIVGYRTDERYKVTESTSEILFVKFFEDL
jgi:tRNA(Ile)-lysidine synthase